MLAEYIDRLALRTSGDKREGVRQIRSCSAHTGSILHDHDLLQCFAAKEEQCGECSIVPVMDGSAAHVGDAWPWIDGVEVVTEGLARHDDAGALR